MDFSDLALANFWLDGPPMTGILRIAIYGALFAAAVLSPRHSPPNGDSPLQAPEVAARSPRIFYHPEGLLSFFKEPSLRSLKIIRWCVSIAWIFCILGFGGRLAAIVTGIGAFYLHGVLAGTLGTNHRWLVPVYTLAALCFSQPNESYSLDALLAQYSWYPFKPCANALLSSGFARNLAFAAAIFTLFAGGVAKLLNGGFRWMDGWTIQFCVSRPAVGASPWIKRFFAERPAACKALAIATMVIELGSPIALIYEPSRLWIIVLAMLLHIGIWLTMNPNYFPQSVCYLTGAPCIGAYARVGPPAFPDAPLLLACFLATCFLLLLIAVAFLRIEWWPLSYVPMYSPYRGPEGAWSYAFIKNELQCEALGKEFIHMKVPYPLTWSDKWIFLRAIYRDGSLREIVNQGITDKHWRRLLNRAAAVIFAHKENEDSSFLKEKQEIIHHWSIADPLNSSGSPQSFELLCRLEKGEKLLAKLKNE